MARGRHRAHAQRRTALPHAARERQLVHLRHPGRFAPRREHGPEGLRADAPQCPRRQARLLRRSRRHLHDRQARAGLRARASAVRRAALLLRPRVRHRPALHGARQPRRREGRRSPCNERVVVQAAHVALSRARDRRQDVHRRHRDEGRPRRQLLRLRMGRRAVRRARSVLVRDRAHARRWRWRRRGRRPQCQATRAAGRELVAHARPRAVRLALRHAREVQGQAQVRLHPSPRRRHRRIRRARRRRERAVLRVGRQERRRQRWLCRAPSGLADADPPVAGQARRFGGVPRARPSLRALVQGRRRVPVRAAARKLRGRNAQRRGVRLRVGHDPR